MVILRALHVDSLYKHNRNEARLDSIRVPDLHTQSPVFEHTLVFEIYSASIKQEVRTIFIFVRSHSNTTLEHHSRTSLSNTTLEIHYRTLGSKSLRTSARSPMCMLISETSIGTTSSPSSAINFIE